VLPEQSILQTVIPVEIMEVDPPSNTKEKEPEILNNMQESSMNTSLNVKKVLMR
ncbi:4826_t:CDS:1, partial [Funneliformis geosporum]